MAMNYLYIEQLLERYWHGETSLEEESILRTFFSQVEIPQYLRPYQELFVYEQQAAKETLDNPGFERHLLERLGIDSESHPAVKARTIRMSDRLKPLFRAAAIIAIVLTLGNAMQKPFSDEGYFPPKASKQTAVAQATDTLQSAADAPLVSQATDSLANGRTQQ